MLNYTKKEFCKICGQIAVNKKYKLCKKHNWIRLHPGESFFKNSFKKGNKLNSFSKKENKNKVELKKIYKEIDLERGLRCEGCGSLKLLSHSHLISRSIRKDLETDKNNIKIHCMQRADGSKGCHNRWEGSLEEKKTLLDFEKNMEYIYKVDLKQYNLILYK